MTPSNMLPDAAGNADNDSIDLSGVLDTLLQYAWWIILIFAFTLAIGISYAILATPIYQADALVQVEDNKDSILSGVQDLANALGNSNSNPVSGEIEILRSREVVLKAINVTHADLRIAVSNRFPVIGDWYARKHGNAGVADAPLGLKSYAWGGEVLALDEFTVPEQAYGAQFVFRATKSGYDIEDADGNKIASGIVGQLLLFKINGHPARAFVSNMSASLGTTFAVVRSSPITTYKGIASSLNLAELGRQSSIIKLSYENSNVEFAQNLINAIARAYLTQNVERRSAEADQSLKFLDQQMPEVKRNVEKTEDDLNNFRTRTNTVSVEKSTEALLGQAVDVERGRLQLEMKRRELLQRYQPEHPLIKSIDSQLAESTREANKVNDSVNQLPVAQRDLLRLERDAQVSNQLYIALLNNAQQLRVAKAGTIGNVRVIDYAVRDVQPVRPKKALVIAAAGTLGVLIGLLAVFVARLLRPTVRDVDEVERATGLVSYATIPESAFQERLDSNERDKRGKRRIVEGRTQLLAALQPDDPAIESLRSLRTGLSFALMGAQNKNIVITGATASLGKSFISANLGLLLASAGKRVLLIESDMRRPQLGTYFGYGKNRGLSDFLANTATLDEVLRREVVPGSTLDVLPSGQIPPNPGELLLSSAFTQLLATVQDQYDHIVLDSAPVLPVGDTLAVARCASTTFIVVRAEQSTVGEVRDAVKKLEGAGAVVKGIIFNGVKRRRVGYGAAYKYYYGYGSK
jgi:tyrosine-protein kinase Etk/Wzc